MNYSGNDFSSQILYEDAGILVVNKCAAQVIQTDKQGTYSLAEQVINYLKQQQKNVFCGIVHRLDRPVSGVVVFAKTQSALSNLNQQFQNRQVRKTYWAIVKNKPMQERDTLVHFVKKNEKQNKSYIVENLDVDVLRAELNYRILAASERYYLLEVNPKTGRHHQIRLQLSAIGCPIKGDLKYGFDRSNKDSSISLHAKEISFIHPSKNEPIVLTACVPQDPLWQFFQTTVEGDL